MSNEDRYETMSQFFPECCRLFFYSCGLGALWFRAVVTVRVFSYSKFVSFVVDPGGEVQDLEGCFFAFRRKAVHSQMSGVNSNKNSNNSVPNM
jgi:hypothetical protein